MSLLFILAGVFVAGTAGLTALIKIYKIGEYMPSTDESILDMIISTKEEVKPVLEPPVASQATLDVMCLAIRDFEGKPGDRNYKNCNPGNVKYNPGGYLKIYGNVKKDRDGFAIFRDMDTGMLYLKNMIKQQIKKKPDVTLLQFMTKYAPPEDDNPTLRYARFVAKRMGVDIGFRVGDIVV